MPPQCQAHEFWRLGFLGMFYNLALIYFPYTRAAAAAKVEDCLSYDMKAFLPN